MTTIATTTTTVAAAVNTFQKNFPGARYVTQRQNSQSTVAVLENFQYSENAVNIGGKWFYSCMSASCV
jgi:phosphoglycerol transferase MdoB-like AlkP superfamily enzyme